MLSGMIATIFGKKSEPSACAQAEGAQLCRLKAMRQSRTDVYLGSAGQAGTTKKKSLLRTKLQERLAKEPICHFRTAKQAER